MSDQRFGWIWILGLAVCLFLPGARLQADEVELVSRTGPGFSPPDTASGASTTERDRDWLQIYTFSETPWATRRAMSADGRYVAYVSTAVNLVSGQQDAGLDRDVFLYDRETGVNTLVSRSAASPAVPAAGESYAPVISADGRYVAFVSTARDLVPGQTDENYDSYPPGREPGEDVFLYDRDSGSVTLVSRTASSAVTTGNYRSRAPVISADGRYVAFESNASNLVAGQSDSPQSKDIFLFDRISGSTVLVSHAAGSTTLAVGAYEMFNHITGVEEDGPEISADGGFVAFLSASTDLVAGQTGQGVNLFLFERSTGAVSLVSHAVGWPTAARGASASGISSDFGLSSDGRYVAFASPGADLVAGQTDPDSSADVFLYDRQTDTHILVSRMPGTATTAGGGTFAALDAGGEHVVFASTGSLVAGQTDPNGSADLFVFDRTGGMVALVSRATGSPSTTGNGQSIGPVISEDGSVIVFNSQATDLVSGLSDTSNGWDLFAYSLATGTVELVSRTAAALPGNRSSFYPLVSADGRYVAFTSIATDLVQGVEDSNNFRDVFLHDRVEQSTAAVSLHGPGMDSVTPMAASSASAISADGRFVVFLSKAANLVSGQIDQNSADDVFLYDRVSGTTVLVSRIDGTSATTGNGEASAPSISADGGYVVFLSKATNLVSGQMDGPGDDVFVFERSSGAVALVSGANQSPQITADRNSRSASISADGNWIVFVSEATNLVPGQVDKGDYQHVFLRNRQTGTTILVSGEHGSPTVEAGNGAYAPSISADGRFIAFTSTAQDLVNEMNGVSYNNREQIFVYDRASSEVQLVSFASGSPSTVANGRCYVSRISADGRFVAFNSWGTNLVPGQADTNDNSDFFLHDRLSGSTILVTGAGNSPTQTSSVSEGVVMDFSMSADGRYVAFESSARDLVPGQVDPNHFFAGPQPDVFLFDRLTGLKALVSHVEGSPMTASQFASLGGISADGNFVLFDDSDTKLYYVPLGSLTTVSRPNPPETGSANWTSRGAALSANGQFAVFDSLASNLVANDFNNGQDVFLYTRDLLPGRSFYTLTPCRVLDTRQPQDGPALTSGQTETLSLHGVCGIPATARAVAVNVTVTQPTGSGYLVFYPGDAGPPVASTINFGPGQTRANNAILSLALNGMGTLKVSPALTGGGSVHLLLDVVGYFE